MNKGVLGETRPDPAGHLQRYTTLADFELYSNLREIISPKLWQPLNDTWQAFKKIIGH